MKLAILDADHVHEAKTHFSDILKLVASGEEVVVAKAGKPGPCSQPPAGNSRKP